MGTSSAQAARPCTWNLSNNRDNVFYEVAASLNNNAVNLFKDKEYSDSLMLLKQSLDLLNKVGPLYASTECAVKATPKHCDVPSNDRNACKVSDLNEMIIIDVMDLNRFQERVSENQEFVGVVVMYNMFLLLTHNGHNEGAFQMLELVHSIVKPYSEEAHKYNYWHPTFIMTVLYHLGTLALGSGEEQLAWCLLAQSIKIGKKLSRTRGSTYLYAKICSSVGGSLMDNNHFLEAQSAFEEAALVYQQSHQFLICNKILSDGSSDKQSPTAAAA